MFRRPSPATLIASVALFFSLGAGGALASAATTTGPRCYYHRMSKAECVTVKHQVAHYQYESRVAFWGAFAITQQLPATHGRERRLLRAAIRMLDRRSYRFAGMWVDLKIRS